MILITHTHKHTAKRTNHGSNLYLFHIFIFIFIFISGGEEETMQNFILFQKARRGEERAQAKSVDV